MGQLASNILEFVMDVLVNWRTAIAAIVFAMFSFPNAALSGEAKQRFDQRWPVETRRKWLVRIAIAYVFVSCFWAWDYQRGRVVELQRQISEQGQERKERAADLERRVMLAKQITSAIKEGNQIGRTFEIKDDKYLIRTQFSEWYNKIDAMLNLSVGPTYAAQFESAKGNGLVLLNHNIEGDQIYSLLQGKISVLNTFLPEFRAPPTPQAR